MGSRRIHLSSPKTRERGYGPGGVAGSVEGNLFQEKTMTQLNARPDPVRVDFAKSALIVVDMQNAFASRKGMLDLAGLDIADAPHVVQAVKGAVDAARQAGVPVVYLQMGYRPDLSDEAVQNLPTGTKNWVSA